MRPRLPLLARALLAAALLAGCSHRERTNPLDPANASTGGRPAGFVAVAGERQIALQWTPEPNLVIDGFRLTRLAPGDSLYRTLGPSILDRTGGGWFDAPTTDGLPYRYRLYYVSHGAVASPPAEDEATSGPLRPWVADDTGGLLELSPDGRDIVADYSSFSGNAEAVAVDPKRGFVWASDYGNGSVVVLDTGSLGVVTIPGLSEPGSIAISPADGSGWITELAGAVAHRNPDGSPASPSSLSLLEDPTGIAVDPGDFSVWVCENGGDRVRHFAANGAPLAVAYAGQPDRVVVDSLTHRAIVSSDVVGRIWRFAPDGALVDSTNAAKGPFGLAVDRARERLWVADWAGDRVLGLDLTSLAVVASYGLQGPFSVAVDRATGQVWACSPSVGSVVRLAPDGTRLDAISGLAAPFEVALDPGTRPAPAAVRRGAIPSRQKLYAIVK